MSNTALYLAALHRAERGIAEHITRLSGEPCWGPIATDRATPWVEEQTWLTLSESQRDAVARAVNGKVTVITGGPGVGKTTVVNSILDDRFPCAPYSHPFIMDVEEVIDQTLHFLRSGRFGARPPSAEGSSD